MVELLVRRRTCDLQVSGSSPGWAPLRSGLGQATYTCVLLSPSSIIWYRPRGEVISFAGKVTAGLVESNGSLPPCLWLVSPVGWLPRNRDGSAQCPTLVIEYGTTLLFYLACILPKCLQFWKFVYCIHVILWRIEGWSNWSQWSACSTSCGQGSQVRTRSCSESGNRRCQGTSDDVRNCTAPAVSCTGEALPLTS